MTLAFVCATLLLLSVEALRGVPGWVVMVVSLVLLFLFASRVGIVPYIRMLDRRCANDPLFTEDYFWVYLRRWTLTGISNGHVVTWPLKSVRLIHNEAHLIALRTQRRRVLYIPSTAETSPESFSKFRSGIKQRMHLFWREQFVRVDYIS